MRAFYHHEEHFWVRLLDLAREEFLVQSVTQISTPKCKSLILNHYNNALSEFPLHQPSHHVVQIQRPSNPNFVRASQRSWRGVRETVGQEQGLSLAVPPAVSQSICFSWRFFYFYFYFYLLFPDVHNVLSAVTVEKKESPIRSRHQFSSAAEHRTWGPHRSKMPVIVIVIGSCSAGSEMITRGANQWFHRRASCKKLGWINWVPGNAASCFSGSGSFLLLVSGLWHQHHSLLFLQ